MFEKITEAPHGKTRVTQVSEDHARELLKGYTRDPEYALQRMRDNPFGQLNCEGGRLRWNPED